jgi:hypothetical protein
MNFMSVPETTEFSLHTIRGVVVKTFQSKLRIECIIQNQIEFSIVKLGIYLLHSQLLF